MKNTTICIAGYFDTTSEKELIELEKELRSININLQKHNRRGEIYHSFQEFMDVEFLIFTYELLKTFIMNGSYDVFKYSILKLWNTIQKKNTKERQFTITIDGIPTTTGSETIRFKISGITSKKHKEMVIDKIFDLAKQVEEDQANLLMKDQFYNALNGHIFKYDAANEMFKEIDILSEIEKTKKQ